MLGSKEIFNKLNKMTAQGRHQLLVDKFKAECQFLQDELIGLGFDKVEIEPILQDLTHALYEPQALNSSKLIEKLKEKVPDADLEKINLNNYAVLLCYAQLMFLVERNGIPQLNAYKLSVVFGEYSQAVKYLTKFSKVENMMHDASNYALPQGDYELKVWRKFAIKFMAEPDFFKKILPSANELETYIKQLAPKGKANKEQLKQISEQVKKITALNSSVKKLSKRHGNLTEAQESEYVALTQELVAEQIALTKLNIEFNDQLTLTALKAFKVSMEQDFSPVLRYFTQHGLTQANYEKFINLSRKNDDKQIPDLIIAGSNLNWPGFYLKKVDVLDDLQAARAACLGKLTDCCQSLSGEAGEPCVIHGLTSPLGGFYVLCKGNVNQPSIEDPLYGQCWAWRSQSGAIVFDSIEVSPKATENERQMVVDMYQSLAKELLKEDTHKIACGAFSGISEKLGESSDFIKLEVFEDYDDYSDSQFKQRVIYDKNCPYYFYARDADAKDATKLIIQEALNNQELPLGKQKNFAQMLNWALLENKSEVITAINDAFIEPKPKARLEEFMLALKNYIKREFEGDLEDFPYVHVIDKKMETPLHHACRSSVAACNKLLARGAEVNAKNKRGETPLMLAIWFAKPEICDALIDAGAEIDTQDKRGDTPLMLAIERGNIKTLKILIDVGAEINVKSSDGMTPLMLAIEGAKPEICAMLIDAGADIHVRTLSEQSLFTMALNKGLEGICIQLLDRGCKIDESQNILYDAIGHRLKQLSIKLIEQGVKINEVNQKTNKTPLEKAVISRAEEISLKLLEKGVQPRENNQIILYAISSKPPLVKFCLKYLEKGFIKNKDELRMIRNLKDPDINALLASQSAKDKKNQSITLGYSSLKTQGNTSSSQLQNQDDNNPDLNVQAPETPKKPTP
jgi:ankyrin repeat protein